jgi:tetratricopeptide (TPR) repeat protein
MKKIHTNLLRAAAGLLLLGAGACQQWLDEPRPETSTVLELPQTADDLDGLLTGAYSAFSHPFAQGNIGIQYGDLVSDIIAVQNTGVRNDGDATYRTFQRNLNAGFVLSDRYQQWAGHARNISNVVIESIRTNNVVATAALDPRRDYYTQRDRMLGEALFLRAAIYFELTRMLGHQWGYTEDNSHLGPIARYAPLLNPNQIPAARATVAQSYDSIITNLQQAIELLPVAFDARVHPNIYQPRANRAAAQALLARVYFQQENYESCLAVVNEVLGATPGGPYRFPLLPGNAMLNAFFNRQGITTATNSAATRDEVIFELVITAGFGRNLNTVNNFRYARGSTAVPTVPGPAGPNWRLSQRFKELARFEPQDLRFTTFVDTSQRAALPLNDPGRPWFINKWGVSNTNIPLIRSAELILMRAEILARQGDVNGALADLHAIQARANATPTPAADPATVLAAIHTERLREFFGEGYRFHELKRLRQDFHPGDRSGQDCGPYGCEIFPWNSDRLIFQVNPNELRQNPLALPNP